MTRSLEASECLGGNRIAITTEDDDDDCDDGDDWTGREVPRILASRRVSHWLCSFGVPGCTATPIPNVRKSLADLRREKLGR